MPPPRLTGHLPSFADFILQAKVRTFYRSVLRRLKGHPNQNELKNWARDEIERNRHVKDHNHIKYLLSVAKAEAGNIFALQSGRGPEPIKKEKGKEAVVSECCDGKHGHGP